MTWAEWKWVLWALWLFFCGFGMNDLLRHFDLYR